MCGITESESSGMDGWVWYRVNDKMWYAIKSKIRTYLSVSSRNTRKTSPAFFSIFATPSNGSARLGPVEIMRTSLPCSLACLTSLKAEKVAREVPRTRSLEAFETISSLGKGVSL